MIGILTFYWADDYGAMLQAYALKRQLELMGKQAEFVPYAPVKLTGRYWLCPVLAWEENGKIRYRPKRYLLRKNLSELESFCARRRRMRAFRREYLTAKRPVRSAKGLFLGNYEAVFVGSDQVWNPDITVDLDDAYVGNIPRKGDCLLASYGASISGHVFSQAEEEKLKRCVGGGFSAISLRERGDAQRLERLLGREVRDVLDPTLLLEPAQWTALAVPPAGRDYILLCLTQYHEPLLRCARALSARLGKRILSLNDLRFLEKSPAGATNEGVEVRLEGGPREFLGYVQNAACVLTNSFHATVFSVLMEKPFLTFRHDTRSIRLEELLGKLDLSSRLVEKTEKDEAVFAPVDWVTVRRRLAEEREKSRNFILESLQKIP